MLSGITVSLTLQQIKPPPTPGFGKVPEFKLIESSGGSFTHNDMKGQIWIANFIFTNCAGTCPMMTEKMKRLQEELPDNIKLVSFTVDPYRDTTEVLAQYAKKHRAEPDRWTFATGTKKELYELSKQGFHLAVDDTVGSVIEPITHSTRLALVDRNGTIQAYYSGTDPESVSQLIDNAQNLLTGRQLASSVGLVFDVRDLPALNALLNLTSGLLVAFGIYFIKRKNIRAHKACMATAVGVSALFLTSYLVYHYQVGSVPFEREGWIRTVYLSILTSHTILAVAILPMVMRTVYLAWRGRFAQHVRIARWTYPIWLYVSATGVIVYLMLYQI